MLRWGQLDTYLHFAEFKHFDAIGYGNTPWARFYDIPTLNPENERLAQMVLKALGSPSPFSQKIKPSLILKNNDMPME